MENHPAPDAWHELNPAAMPSGLAEHVIRLQAEHGCGASEIQSPAEQFFMGDFDVNDAKAFMAIVPEEGEARQGALEQIIASMGKDAGRIARVGAVIMHNPSLASELVTAASRSEDDWSMCSALAATEVAMSKIGFFTAEDDDPRAPALLSASQQGQAALGIPEHIDTIRTANGALEVLGESADKISFKDALTYAGTVFHGYNQFNEAFNERGVVVAQEIAQASREVRPDSIGLFRSTSSLETILLVDDYKRQEEAANGALDEEAANTFNELITSNGWSDSALKAIPVLQEAFVAAGIKPVDSARYIASNANLHHNLPNKQNDIDTWLPDMAHALARLDKAGLGPTFCGSDDSNQFRTSRYSNVSFMPGLYRDLDPMVSKDRIGALPIADADLVDTLSMVAYVEHYELADLASGDLGMRFDVHKNLTVGESLRLAAMERTMQNISRVIEFAKHGGDQAAIQQLLKDGLFERAALIGTDEVTLMGAPIGGDLLDSAALDRLLDIDSDEARRVAELLIVKSDGLENRIADRLGLDDFSKARHEKSFGDDLNIDVDALALWMRHADNSDAKNVIEGLIRSGRVQNDDRLAGAMLDLQQGHKLEALIGEAGVFELGSLSADMAERIARHCDAKTVFDNNKLFSQPDLAGILEHEMATGRLGILEKMEPGLVSPQDMQGIFERTAARYLAGVESTDFVPWTPVTYLGALQQYGIAAQPPFIRRAFEVCGSGLSNGMADTFRQVQTGQIGPDLQALGLTGQGEAGLRELAAGIAETASHYRSAPVGPTELAGLAGNAVLRDILASMTKYENSEFGSGGDDELQQLIVRLQEIGPDIATTSYPSSQIYEIGLLRKPKSTEWTEDLKTRYDLLTTEITEARSKGGNHAMNQLQAAVGQTIGSIEQALRSESLNEYARASMSNRVAYLRNLITPTDLARPRTTMPLRDLTAFQQNFTELAKSRELHSALRTTMFSWALAKNPTWRSRLAAAEKTDEVSVEGVSAVSEFVDRIVGEETFKQYFSNKKAAATFRDMTSVKALHAGLLRAQGVGVGRETIPVQFEPRRDVLMELSGHIADACWAGKYDSIAQAYPNLTSVIMKQDPGSEKEKLIGAGMLIEATGAKGVPILVIRGLNPVENTINKVSAEQFTNAFIDYARCIADSKDMALGITIDNHSGGSASNRPVLFEHLTRMRDGLRRIMVTHDSTEFNGYDISNDVYQL